MALSGSAPFIKVTDSNGLPIVGAKLHVYDSGTTNYKTIYSDDGLTTPLSNPLTGANASNASGDFPRFYLAAGTYKLRAETSAGVLIWQYDNIDTALSAGAGALPINRGGTGQTTAAAALAALGGVTSTEVAALSTQISTFTSLLTNVVSVPQGRLTLTSMTPIISSGVTAGTAVYYTPYTGNLIPIYDGTQFNPRTFAELTLTLASQHTLSSHFDCFIINDSGTMRIVTGPAWSTITAGAGERGTGAGTTQLTRLNGILVNANAMATARNGSSTYSVAAYQGTYVGSLYIDGTAGQVTCHTAWGSSRKWGVWNYYNRVPIILKAGDSTASWTYTSTTIRQSNAATGNTLAAFTGAAEEQIEISFKQRVQNANSADNTTRYNLPGIGVNSTTAYSGFVGVFGNAGSNTSAPLSYGNGVAEYAMSPALGLNNVNALESMSSASSTTGTWFGTEANMVLSARWRG